VTNIELIANDYSVILAHIDPAKRRQPKSPETTDHSYCYLIAVTL